MTTEKSAKRRLGQGIAVITTSLAMMVSLGCGSETANMEETEGAGASAVQPSDRGAAERPDRVFDEETVKEHKCDLVTLADVESTTGVPASAIEEKLSGCLYTWDEGADWIDGTVYLGSLRVHDSVEQAKRSYARSTEDVTVAEASTAKEETKESLAEKREAGEMTKSQEAGASTLVDAMPEMDFTHRRLDGIGSEAAMDDGGTVYIRYGNVTIEFSGKSGGEDRLSPERAAAIGRRIIANLDRL